MALILPPTFTVRQFLFQMYRLINSSNPTIPLHGDDDELALLVLNQLLEFYAGTGLMITIAKTVKTDINIGIFTVKFVDPDFPTQDFQFEMVNLTAGSPTFTVANGALYQVGDTVIGNAIPLNTIIGSIVGNIITLSQNATFTGTFELTFIREIIVPGTVFIKNGRLANLDSAWLLLDGVTYPLIIKSRDDYLASWKFNPLQGLPRFVILFPDTDVVTLRLYPAPSQFFEFHCRGKFQLPRLTKDSDMSSLPLYYIRYLLLAVARDVSLFKGRADAWTDKLEARYLEAFDTMAATSEVNLSVTGEEESLLNGSWRVRSGI
jgi:hypothetical protein